MRIRSVLTSLLKHLGPICSGYEAVFEQRPYSLSARLLLEPREYGRRIENVRQIRLKVGRGLCSPLFGQLIGHAHRDARENRMEPALDRAARDEDDSLIVH